MFKLLLLFELRLIIELFDEAENILARANPISWERAIMSPLKKGNIVISDAWKWEVNNKLIDL